MSKQTLIETTRSECHDSMMLDAGFDRLTVSHSDFLEILDARATPQDQRFDVWRDLVNLVCGPLRVLPGDADDFHGSIVRGQFGAVQTSLIDAGAHSVERTEQLIERADTSHLYVCEVLGGEVHLGQDGQTATARAGNLIAFDSSRPYTLAMPQPVRMIAVRFAHRLVGLAPRDTSALTATIWSGQHGVSVLVSHLLRGVASRMTEFSAASADQLGNSVGSLIAALFAERLQDTVTDPKAARQSLLLRIQSFAREHLSDPALGPALLARQHNISLRYLQVLFQEQETSPARWIRDERLERCHEDLRNPRFAHLTVASIGERWGLPGASHFSRLFRERYQMTPREYRRQWQQLTDLKT